MTNELTYFAVEGFYYDIESPATNGTTNTPQFNGLTGGFITFTPRVPPGFVIEITNLDLGSGNTGSAAISLAPITGRVTGTLVGTGYVWQLAAINTTDTPEIQLLANFPAVSTYLNAQGINAGILVYDVSFDRVTFAGAAQTINNFAFTAPTGSEAPTSLSATQSGTGGTLAANTYYYGVTTVMPWGETAPSNIYSVTTTGTTSTASLTWTVSATSGALSQNIYRGTSATSLTALLTNVSSSTTTYTDTGGAGSAITAPTVDTVSITSPTLTRLPYQAS